MILNEISLDSPVEFDWSKKSHKAFKALFRIESTNYETDLYLVKGEFWNVGFKPSKTPDALADSTLTNDHALIKVLSTVRAIILDFIKIKKPTKRIGMFSTDPKRARLYQRIVRDLVLPGFSIVPAKIDYYGKQGDYASGVWLTPTALNESKKSVREIMNLLGALYHVLENERLTSS